MVEGVDYESIKVCKSIYSARYLIKFARDSDLRFSKLPERLILLGGESWSRTKFSMFQDRF